MRILFRVGNAIEIFVELIIFKTKIYGKKSGWISGIKYFNYQ